MSRILSAGNLQYAVYIYHLSQKLAHAQHYVGLCELHSDPVTELKERLAEHRAGRWRPGEKIEIEGHGSFGFGDYVGNGSKFLGACNYHHITYTVVRYWITPDPYLERRLKNTHAVKYYCPFCTPRGLRDIE